MVYVHISFKIAKSLVIVACGTSWWIVDPNSLATMRQEKMFKIISNCYLTNYSTSGKQND